MTIKPTRLTVVDALRGFSIVAIMLLHNIEHFDVYFLAQNLPAWMVSVDKIIWDTLFFLFGGKVYAIFALLFGLTFFIQSDNQEKKGFDFRARFAWRMLLLLVFGFINSMFYQGDILTLYALVGFFIIPFAKLNNKWVFLFATLLMLQPFEWFKFISAAQHPDVLIADPTSWSYFGKMWEYIPGKSIVELWIGNLSNGRKATLLWFWENGRVLQTLSLFLFGMLAGRKSLFNLNNSNKKFWQRSLLIAALAFVPLFIIQKNLGNWIESKAMLGPLSIIETSWLNMSFMMILVSGFVLLFHTKIFSKILNVFSPMGRMSLSNYMIQSIIGSFIYYGYGLGLYKTTGSTYCLFIGISLAILQGLFSTWWMKTHKHGPLEYLWHKATWVKIK
ncbi:MAG: DUF418 domain-containing protein [Prolixibacteraceae bacterium]|jgi:uncharacterized protein|nr:DUF418 domain-containing protein [Prolixibacteraceae bacterium]